MASGGLFDPALLAGGYANMQQAPPGQPAAAAPAAAAAANGGSAKKGRKPYTITKPRESWTKEEHQLFLDALQMYERDWKRIGEHVQTKSIIQIRSHAQKYFIKMAKMGLKEYIPAPARPKRKAPKPAGRAKRQRTGDEDDDGGEEEEEGDGEGGEEGDAPEEDDGDAHMHTVPASPNSKAAARLHGLASIAKAGEIKRPAPAVARPSGGSARKVPPPGALRRGSSIDDSAEGTRRSGRKRVQKRKFEDEEYGEGDENEEEQDDDDQQDDDQPASLTSRRRHMGGKVAPSRMQQHSYDEQGPDEDEYGDGQPDDDDDAGHSNSRHSHSPYTSNPPSQPPSNPTTPLRKGDIGSAHRGVAGAHGAVLTPGTGLNQLSQLSPLSQLSQATELDIGAHLLPASVYNPKLKPYPGMHQMRSTAGLGGLHGAPPLHAPATRPHHPLARPEHLATSAAAAHASSLAINTEGNDSASGMGDSTSATTTAASGSASAPEVQPELAKVYSFLGSLFDPSTSGHVEELDKMTPVNKEIVQKLMQNLATNLSSSPTQSSSSLGNDALLGVGSVASRLLGAPKHLRTSSLGSIGSLGVGDALSPEMGHRWIGGPEPSVSPVPAHPSSVLSSLTGPPLAGNSTTSTHGSPTAGYLPRSFSSEGLTVSVIPPGAMSSAAAVGLSGSAGAGSSASGSAWSTDKSRPGFASTALMSRLTARGALSPLSVNPLANGSSVPYAASSPTGLGSAALGPMMSGTGSMQLGMAAYGSYAMSPVAPHGTPMSFAGSPGGFFSPGSAAGAPAAAASASATGEHHQYPAVKAEQPTSNTLNVPASSTAAALNARIASASPSSAVPAAPSPSASAGPSPAVSPSHAVISMLHTSPIPPAVAHATTATT